MKAESNKKLHVVYLIILVLVVVNLFLLGNYYVAKIKDDYESNISSLNTRLNNLENDFENQIKKQEEQQLQINSLSDDFSTSSQEYEMVIGELNQKVSDLTVESDSFAYVIDDKIDAVVSVLTDKGQGSGAIISSEGYFITNYHVIEGVRRANVLAYDSQKYKIKLVGYDIKKDLALLQIISNETFDYFEFSDSDSLKAGQKVVALGNPAGLSFTATEGIISSPVRVGEDGFSYIQTDVTLNPGNSGGPLINTKGEIIGIVDFKVSGYEELGFAIPSSRVEGFVNEVLG